MNMLRFTAEASLYKTSRHYRALAGTPNALVARQQVLPQAPNTGQSPGSNYGRCVGNLLGCIIKCHDKYPSSNDSSGNLNELYRNGCVDSCSSAYSLCQTAIGTSWGTGFYGGTNSPTVFLG
jgi:hypothetical protein